MNTARTASASVYYAGSMDCVDEIANAMKSVTFSDKPVLKNPQPQSMTNHPVSNQISHSNDYPRYEPVYDHNYSRYSNSPTRYGPRSQTPPSQQYRYDYRERYNEPRYGYRGYSDRPPRYRTPPRYNRSYQKETRSCHYCHRRGHLQNACRTLKRDLEQSRSGSRSPQGHHSRQRGRGRQRQNHGNRYGNDRQNSRSRSRSHQRSDRRSSGNRSNDRVNENQPLIDMAL